MIIKALDCTLRDGGYVNLWNFGAENISKIVHNLTESRVEFIELGFLKPCQYDINKTLFNSVDDFDKFIPQSRSDKTLYLGMITFGQYDLSLIPERKNTNVDGFRIIFKKPQWKEALEYCKKVKEKGYKIFINPMHTYNYSDIQASIIFSSSFLNSSLRNFRFLLWIPHILDIFVSYNMTQIVEQELNYLPLIK